MSHAQIEAMRLREHELWASLMQDTELASRRATRKAWHAIKRRIVAAESKQQERDERREVNAQACNCLIEAFEEMRGHPDWHAEP